MVLRISETNGIIFTNVKVPVPEGMIIVPEQFKSYVVLAIENITLDIKYNFVEWNYCFHDFPFVKVDTESHDIFSSLSPTEVVRLLSKPNVTSSLLFVDYDYS